MNSGMMDQGPTQPPASELSVEASRVLDNLQHNGFLCTPPVDNSPQILNYPYFAAHVSSMEESPMVQLDSTVLIAIGSHGRALFGREEATPDDIEDIDRFAAKKPVFKELPAEAQSESIAMAHQAFSADEAGIIFKLLYDAGPAYTPMGKVEMFPAIQRDGTMYRLTEIDHMEGKSTPPETLARAFELLAPPSEVRRTGNVVQAAVQFVEDAERPKQITQHQLDDWLDRLRESGVKFGDDFAVGDDSLDNFLLVDGRLVWCDGNLIAARALSTKHEIGVNVDAQREKLRTYLEPSGS